MSDVKHTELPWEEDSNNPGYITAKRRDGFPVYVAGVYDRPGENNIELICRAVNNHDVLVEALDEGMNVLADIAGEEDFKGWNDTIAKMSKVLAKAKGES